MAIFLDPNKKDKDKLIDKVRNERAERKLMRVELHEHSNNIIDRKTNNKKQSKRRNPFIIFRIGGDLYHIALHFTQRFV